MRIRRTDEQDSATERVHATARNVRRWAEPITSARAFALFATCLVVSVLIALVMGLVIKNESDKRDYESALRGAENCLTIREIVTLNEDIVRDLAGPEPADRVRVLGNDRFPVEACAKLPGVTAEILQKAQQQVTNARRQIRLEGRGQLNPSVPRQEP